MKKREEIEKELGLDLCPIRTILAQISDKWSLLVILTLKESGLRFSAIQRAIPDISQRMLTQTLRKLERDGLVSRKVTPTIPPRVDYAITVLGQTLFEPIDEMTRWAVDKQAAIVKARALYDGGLH